MRYKEVGATPRTITIIAYQHQPARSASRSDLSLQVEIVSIENPDQPVATLTETLCVQPGPNHASWTLSIPDVRPWSTDDPHRYLARITISSSQGTEDACQVTFGMRELTIRDNRLVLNGEPVYLKAAFFEGLYPTRLALPDNVDMARRELQLAKDAGFNMIRPWRKPPPPHWLDLCDEMGLMVVGGMAIECMQRWPTVTPHLSRRIENEVRSAILRDRNRACIVQWELFNEIWRKELERMKHSMSMLARDLDPSRLILDESGGFAGGSNIYLPNQREPDTFNDVHRYPGAPFSNTAYDQMLAIAAAPQETPDDDGARTQRENILADRLTIVSEIGHGSLPDLVDNNQRFQESGNSKVPPYRYHRELEDSYRAALASSGLDGLYPNFQAFCREQQIQHGEANQRMIEAIRCNPRIQGYAVHALTDGDWVLGAGLIDLFRNPKEVYHYTRAANQPVYLALRPQPRNVYARDGLRFTVTGINDRSEQPATLRLRVQDPQGATVWEHEDTVILRQGVSPLLDQHLDMIHGSGTFTLHGSLDSDAGKTLAEQVTEFDVFGEDTLRVPDSDIAVLDPTGLLCPFLESRGIPFRPFDEQTPKDVPVFVTLPPRDSSEHESSFRALRAFVEEGGTAIYLELFYRSPKDPFWAAELPDRDVLPPPALKQHALGLWVCVSHVVREHPIFRGLPVNRIMGQVYENVWTPQTLCDTGGELIAASVSHNYHQHDTVNQHYMGPESAWVGMDVGVVPSGNGRYVLSALRLLEHLGSDPVADKILYNIIEWTTR